MKLPHNLLPTIINLLLVVPLAYGFSVLSEQFFKSQPASKTTTRQFTTIPASQQLPSTDPGEIARWHLFGRMSAKQAAPKQKKIIAPDTPLKLVLRGVAAENNRHGGLAIIQKPNREEKYFKVGDNVFGQASLEEIYTDRVILLRKGRYETLRLPEKRINRNGRKPATSKKTRRTITAEQHVAFMKQEMKKIHKMTLEEMRNPWQYVYFEPAMVDGKIKGLKFTAEEEKEFLAKYGLALGDIITSVNGHRLDGGAGLAKAMNILSDGGKLELVVDRRGLTKTFTIETDDDE